jgi:hypothetical protein
MRMSGDQYRESLRRFSPKVYLNGCCIKGCMAPLPDPKVISLQKKKA